MRQKISRAAFGVLLCVFLLMFFTGPGHALSTVDVFRLYSPSVATLVVTTEGGKEGQGTGFLVSSRGELLTNFHVVDGAESIGVYFSDNLWYSAKRVIAQDPAKDLALLWVEGVSPSLPYLGVNQIRPPEGSDLIVIGTPRGLDKTITTGIVSGYRALAGASSLIQFTAPVSPGSSGSPVFDTGGKVIGVVIGGHKGASGMNFAIEAKDIIHFLQTRPFIKANANAGPVVQRPLADTKNAPKPSQPRSFPDIVATLDMTSPGSNLEPILSRLGKPTIQEERGQDYMLHRWAYPNHASLLFVWDRGGQVERTEWVEYYTSKEEAAARANAITAQASKSFGKNTRTSASGAGWKHSGYVLSISQHSNQKSNMVMVSATR